MLEKVMFGLEEEQYPELLPPLALAYIGDAVYELYVRQRLFPGAKQQGRMLLRAFAEL